MNYNTPIENYEQLQREYFKQADYQNYLNNYDFNAPVEEIEPLEPLNFDFEKKTNKTNGGNINDNRNYLDYFNRTRETEKEKERKKQIEYKKQLEEQILENKIRKEKERERRRQEDLIYEQKMKEKERFSAEKNQEKLKKKNLNDNIFFANRESDEIRNGKTNYNKEELEQELFNSHPGLEKIMKNIKVSGGQNDNSSYNLNNSNKNFNNTNINNINFQNSNYYKDNNQKYDPQNNFQNNNNSQNYYNGRNQVHNIQSASNTSNILPNNYYISNRMKINNIPNEENYYQNNNIKVPQTPQPHKMNSFNFLNNNNDSLLNNQINQNYQLTEINQQNSMMNSSSPNLQMNLSHNNNAFINQFNNNQNLNNNNNNQFNNNQNYQSNMNINNNNNNQLNNNNQNYQNNINNNLSYPPILEKIFDFFKEQIRIIQDYKLRIDQLQNERDQAIVQNKLNEEKILAMQKIKEQQSEMEKNFGNLPYYQGIKNNMEHTISTLLEKDESTIKRNDDNRNNRRKKNNNNKNKINEHNNNNEFNHLLRDITYKSKYENQDNNMNNSLSKRDMTKNFEENKNECNILNFDENDITYTYDEEQIENQNPLITSTKLVKQNGDKKLMETWNKDKIYISKQNKNDENIEQNNGINNSKLKKVNEDNKHYNKNNNNNLNELERNEIPFILNEESNSQRIDIYNDNFKKINNLFNKKKDLIQNEIIDKNNPKVEKDKELLYNLNQQNNQIIEKPINLLQKNKEKLIELNIQNEIIEDINTNKNNISTIPKNPLDDKSFSIDENVKPFTNLDNDLNDNSFKIETNEQNNKSSISNNKDNNNVDSIIEEEEKDFKNKSQLNILDIPKKDNSEIPKNIILLNKDNNITISNSLSKKFVNIKNSISSERYEIPPLNETIEDQVNIKENKDNNSNIESIKKVVKETNLDTYEKNMKLNFEKEDDITSSNNLKINNNDQTQNNCSEKSIYSEELNNSNISQKSISDSEEYIKEKPNDLSNENDLVNIGNQFMDDYKNIKFEKYEEDINEKIIDKDKENDIEENQRKEIQNLNKENYISSNNNTITNNNNTISSNQTLKFRDNIANQNYHFSLTRQKNPFELAQLSKELNVKIDKKDYEFPIEKNDKITEKNESELSSEIPFIKNINDKPIPTKENSLLKKSNVSNSIKQYPQSQYDNNEILLNKITLFDDDINSNISKENIMKSSHHIIGKINFENQQRLPRGVTVNNIKNLNEMYSSFKKKKNEKSIISNESSRFIDNNNSVVNESLISNKQKIKNQNIKINDNSSVFSVGKGDDELFNKVGKYAKFANNEIDQI